MLWAILAAITGFGARIWFWWLDSFYRPRVDRDIALWLSRALFLLAAFLAGRAG